LKQSALGTAYAECGYGHVTHKVLSELCGWVPQALTYEFAMSPLALSQTSPIEILAAALLIATAVLALIATNASRPRLARSAMWLSFATVAGSIYALIATYNGATALPWTAAGQSPISVAEMMTYATAKRGSQNRGDIIRDCEDCPAVVVIPAGWFRMGASANDAKARPQELPATTVRLPRDFAIGQTEVTVRQFETFLVSTGHPVPACWSANGGGNAAATCVSWQDAVAYTRWLNKITGRPYRLPSASEWEYAARAGSGQSYPVAVDQAASVQRVSYNGSPAPTASTQPDGVSGASGQNLAVALGTPNYFGLYDVNGGAAELTQDCWTPTLEAASGEGTAVYTAANCDRVVKDGMWSEDAARARYSARRSINPDKAVAGVGFRVVRELSHGRN
jgi:formylglycine-generating enzyme required for sulfatase activity